MSFSSALATRQSPGKTHSQICWVLIQLMAVKGRAARAGEHKCPRGQLEQLRGCQACLSLETSNYKSTQDRAQLSPPTPYIFLLLFRLAMNGTPHSRHLVQNLGIYFDPFLGSSKGPPSSVYSTFQISQSVLPFPSLLVLAHHPAPGSSSSLLAGLPTPTLPLPSCPIQCQSGLPTATEPEPIPARNLSEL